MNWFMSLFGGRMFNKGLQQQMQAPNRNMLGRGMMMSLLTLAGSAVAYGVIRRRNGGGNMVQRIMQPLRNRLFR